VHGLGAPHHAVSGRGPPGARHRPRRRGGRGDRRGAARRGARPAKPPTPDTRPGTERRTGGGRRGARHRAAEAPRCQIPARGAVAAVPDTGPGGAPGARCPVATVPDTDQAADAPVPGTEPGARGAWHRAAAAPAAPTVPDTEPRRECAGARGPGARHVAGGRGRVPDTWRGGRGRVPDTGRGAAGECQTPVTRLRLLAFQKESDCSLLFE
jgi:hypothetical protein